MNNKIFNAIMSTFFKDIGETIIPKTYDFCDCCPLREVCEELNLAYGCMVYEESMGGDL